MNSSNKADNKFTNLYDDDNIPNVDLPSRNKTNCNIKQSDETSNKRKDLKSGK